MHGVIIAGTHSGCGKTTVTIGLLAALKRKGLEVQSFKAGPDFIDSGIHRLITGRPSRNLDIWMCGKDNVTGCFQRYTTDADIAVVEGVMGMHDGAFSTAHLALLLGLPVILVVDAYGMAESAGAVVKGFIEYSNELKDKKDTEDLSLATCHSSLPSDSSLNWAGVIFNRVASDHHYKRLKSSIRDIPVLGYLPRSLDFEIPHRHLGLIAAEENPISGENLERLADAVTEHIDIEQIRETVDSPRSPRSSQERRNKDYGLSTADRRLLRIAVAYDKAFCFYYEDNLDMLRDAGAEIIKFSPLSDKRIPGEADAVYIGGGYPELHTDELSRNTSMLESVREWACSGKPLYAECGGLMYLSQGIHDFEGGFFRMAGAFPFETQMRKGRAHLGYREIVLKEDCITGRKGGVCRGHEFHYSEIIEDRDASSVMGNELTDKDNESLDASRITHYASRSLTLCYSLLDSTGQELQDEGYSIKRTLASYIHIHFGSNPCIADNFLNFIKER